MFVITKGPGIDIQRTTENNGIAQHSSKFYHSLLLLVSFSVLMRSTKTQSLPKVSPRKSPVRKSSSNGSLRTVSPLKRPTKQRANSSAGNKSDSGLVSSFRKLSITPNPPPPSRSKSTSPRKLKSSHVRALSSYAINSVEDIVNLIKEDKCKNIIVMAGAGISTPSGIPDFR